MVLLHNSSGNELVGSTIGIAFTATMCEPRSAVGLVQDGGANLEDLISTTAHELGHIFAMDHDIRESYLRTMLLHIFTPQGYI